MSKPSTLEDIIKRNKIRQNKLKDKGIFGTFHDDPQTINDIDDLIKKVLTIRGALLLIENILGDFWKAKSSSGLKDPIVKVAKIIRLALDTVKIR